MPRFLSRIFVWFSRPKNLVFLADCIFGIAFVLWISPAIAESSGCSLSIPDSWKSHFPFDLIYPIGPAYSGATSCPLINFWGQDRQVCAIPQLTAVIKYPILARVAIRGLFEL